MENGTWKNYGIANPNVRMLFWAIKVGPCHKLRESEQALG